MYDNLIKHSKNREKLDFYATEPLAVSKLLERETFRNIVYEPACGQGHIAKVLLEYKYKVKATDIEYRGYGQGGVDFFDVKENAFDIVINPPYFCATEFIEHTLKISKQGVKIAMLFRLGFLESKSRYKLFKTYPPKKIYVFLSRIHCAKNGDFEKYKSGAISFAWFIWQVGYNGESVVDWIM